MEKEQIIHKDIKEEVDRLYPIMGQPLETMQGAIRKAYIRGAMAERVRYANKQSSTPSKSTIDCNEKHDITE